MPAKIICQHSVQIMFRPSFKPPSIKIIRPPKIPRPKKVVSEEDEFKKAVTLSLEAYEMECANDIELQLTLYGDGSSSSTQLPSTECCICLSPVVSDSAVTWTCAGCLKQLHGACRRDWKGGCPHCRLE